MNSLQKTTVTFYILLVLTFSIFIVPYKITNTTYEYIARQDRQVKYTAGHMYRPLWFTPGMGRQGDTLSTGEIDYAILLTQLLVLTVISGIGFALFKSYSNINVFEKLNQHKKALLISLLMIILAGVISSIFIYYRQQYFAEDNRKLMSLDKAKNSTVLNGKGLDAYGIALGKINDFVEVNKNTITNAYGWNSKKVNDKSYNNVYLVSFTYGKENKTEGFYFQVNLDNNSVLLVNDNAYLKNEYGLKDLNNEIAAQRKVKEEEYKKQLIGLKEKYISGQITGIFDRWKLEGDLKDYDFITQEEISKAKNKYYNTYRNQ